MGNSLLSIDWDYFISSEDQDILSCVENNRTIIEEWYKRYFKMKSKGLDIHQYYQLSNEIDTFWDKIKQIFRIEESTKVFVSDSHALSYNIAKNFKCDKVYLFDAHSDLGYGGFSSLTFEVNCANWLGHLLKQKQIKEANIIYSPYTKERPEYFNKMNKRFNIKYLKMKDLINLSTNVIHICRSGAWSPPWFDNEFTRFVKSLNIPFKVVDCPSRRWKTNNLTLADQIHYLMA
ncbi:arginase [Ureibacillus acetophenoni]